MSLNLIPPQLKATKRLQHKLTRVLRYLTRLLLLIVILAGVAFLGNYLLSKKNDAINRNIENTKAEITAYADTENQINQINTKLTKIETANKTRILWSKILAELAVDTPKQVAIHDLSLSQDSKSISLSGEAESREIIAQFKEKLEGSSYFQNVFFSSSSQNESHQNYTFSLTADLEKNQ